MDSAVIFLSLRVQIGFWGLSLLHGLIFHHQLWSEEEALKKREYMIGGKVSQPEIVYTLSEDWCYHF